jgi:rhamnogalacturonan endolyase
MLVAVHKCRLIRGLHPTFNLHTQPRTRSLTIGSYRGNNITFTYAIPASAFVAGTNTLMINVISISEHTGYLSAGCAYDCVELDN